jgi:hypothetical protein
MGCDIHLYKEKKIDSEWVTADTGWVKEYGEIDIPYENQFTDRNYELFGFLSAGVRCEFEFSFKPRGMPFNVCLEVSNICESWNGDGHSHSYLTLSELCEAWEYLKTQTIPISGMMEPKQLANLKESIEAKEDTNWNFLYPYCAWTNDESQVQFTVDIPAQLQLKALKEIIGAFDKINAEDLRIVFWFDN